MAYSVYLAITVMTTVTTLGRLIDAAASYAPESVARFEVVQMVGPGLLGFIWLSSIVYMFTENLKFSDDAV